MLRQQCFTLAPVEPIASFPKGFCRKMHHLTIQDFSQRQWVILRQKILLIDKIALSETKDCANTQIFP
jgi:hypothetical protein